MREEGAQERLAEFVHAVGGETDRAEAGGVGFGLRGDCEGRFDEGEVSRQRREIARHFELVVRTAEDFAAEIRRRALGDDAALVDDQDAVAGHFDLGEDMRGDDDGHAAAEAGDEIADDEDLMRIQADGGLVHDNDGRLGEDGFGDADALAVAFGKLADDFVPDPFQVAELENFVDARPEFAAGDLFEAAAKIEILRDAHVFRERIVFRHVADLALDIVRLSCDGQAADPDTAGRRRQVTGEDAHGGRFTGTVGSEKADDFAARHGETDIGDRSDPSVGFYEVGDFDGERLERGGRCGHGIVGRGDERQT